MMLRTGWLLDIYPDPESGGLALWLLDENGERVRLQQHFPFTFYAAGPARRLRELWIFLQSQDFPVELQRSERRDLFHPDPLCVLQIRVLRPGDFPALFRRVESAFPDLDYYDADIGPVARYAAQYDIFLLTRCRLQVDENGWVQAAEPLESRWALEPSAPPLRVLTLEPSDDPGRGLPESIRAGWPGGSAVLRLQPERALLVGLNAILRRCDPDLILTDWGDTWLLPYLLDQAQQRGIPLQLSRDTALGAKHKKEYTYFSYGQIVHRGQQVHLYGRWHVDRRNGMMYSDYGLEGIFEMARVTGLPLQVAARNSPGAGITAMEVITALQQEVLTPYRKQQTERFKTASDLIHSDRGGMIYQPQVGLHEDVAELDFSSMYPSTIVRLNLSAETVGVIGEETLVVPGLRLPVRQDIQGLLPRTLHPLVEKRMELKKILSELDPRDCRTPVYKARSTALKWLLVVSFGYTGYKNAKFGRIEAHEAVTAYAREALLRSKEAAEELGFEVLHMYVDGMWVCRPGSRRKEDYQELLDRIFACTSLPVALDGIFKWIAFLPSRLDERVPVPNRYFGVFQNGEIKVRGIEARRRDTPPFVAQVQMEMLRILARADRVHELPSLLPEVFALLRRRLRELRSGRVPLEKLVVRQKISRAPGEYHTLSPAARAAMQLEAAGREVRAGQSIRFVFMRGEPDVAPWNLPETLDAGRVDVDEYTKLLFRAAETVLQPLGVDAGALQSWVLDNAGYACRGFCSHSPLYSLPMWAAAG